MNARPRTLHANGLTFSALEDGRGPLVLCLHGFPDHNRTYRMQFAPLVQAGYRVVAPMNRGYESSSQPKDGDYSIASLAKDVVGWMDDLGAKRVHLVGHDWGAVIGYAVAALAPERLDSLTTMAVPHLRRMHQGVRRIPIQAVKSSYMLFFQLQGLADAIVKRNDYAFVERLWRTWSPDWVCPPEEMESLKATFRDPGVHKAALEYYRCFFRPFSSTGRETMRLLTSPIDVPTLALTGANDGCMDSRLYDTIMDPADFPQGLRVARIAGAGHFLHLEKPEEVNREILRWLVETE
jgi:pimeloyl-ACP methyl ester carboxylesterase